MNFCSNCGSKVSLQAVPGDEKPRHYCSNCDTIHYLNPKIVVGCIPTYGDQVLLCKRNIEPRKGYWNVPGGYMENGETLEEGAAREVWEEAFAKVSNLKPFLLYSIPHISQVYVHFRGDLGNLDFRPGFESQEVELFDENSIPWKEIAFTSSGYALKKYFEDLKRGAFRVHSSLFDLNSWMEKNPRK